ncbi:MAG: hypothetical protein AAGF15_04095 [Pseudomonadota bacterium]
MPDNNFGGKPEMGRRISHIKVGAALSAAVAFIAMAGLADIPVVFALETAAKPASAPPPLIVLENPVRREAQPAPPEVDEQKQTRERYVTIDVLNTFTPSHVLGSKFGFSTPGASLALNGLAEGTFTPRALSLDDGSGATRPRVGIVIGGLPSEIEADRFVSFKDGPGQRPLTLTFSSAVNLLGDSGQQGVLNRPRQYDSRFTDLGLNLEYSRFGLDANFHQFESSLDRAVRGIDLGFSVSGRAWRTSLLVEGYQASGAQKFLSLDPLHDRYYAVEVGASYSLFPGFHVSGGIRFSEFRDAFGAAANENSDGLVYIGSAFRF